MCEYLGVEAEQSSGRLSDLVDQPELYKILVDHAYRGIRVQRVLRGVLVGFAVAVVLWISPARDRVACYILAATYAAWAVGLGWFRSHKETRAAAVPETLYLRFMWLTFFVDLAALAGLSLIASSSVNQSWTADVVVNGFFVIPILTATQVRPWVCTAVGLPAVALYLASSIAAKQANGEPWSSIVLRTGVLAGIFVGSMLLSQVQRSRLVTVGRLAFDRIELLTELTTTEDRERRTLSEDLHDGALQYVLAVRQDLDETRESVDPLLFSRMDYALRETTQLLRSTMTQLHPAVLEEAGLLPAIRDLVHSASERGHLEISVDAEEWDETEQTSVDGLLLAAARELLSNVVKHARAHVVHIDLSRRDGTARLSVADDGQGIRPGEVERQLAKGHIGLTSRRIRLEAAGGRLTLRPRQPSGTIAEVEVPVPQGR